MQCDFAACVSNVANTSDSRENPGRFERVAITDLRPDIAAIQPLFDIDKSVVILIESIVADAVVRAETLEAA